MSAVSAALRITVNGAAVESPQGLSVEQLLAHLKLPAGRVAVERNRDIVRRGVRDRVLVQEGDVFEIVTFVGGG
ncbi:MAG: sulfur carrier protein ThiS [Vicinamibacteria bacterium]